MVISVTVVYARVPINIVVPVLAIVAVVEQLVTVNIQLVPVQVGILGMVVVVKNQQ